WCRRDVGRSQQRAGARLARVARRIDAGAPALPASGSPQPNKRPATRRGPDFRVGQYASPAHGPVAKAGGRDDPRGTWRDMGRSRPGAGARHAGSAGPVVARTIAGVARRQTESATSDAASAEADSGLGRRVLQSPRILALPNLRSDPGVVGRDV